MISKKKAVAWIIVALLVTNIATFVGSNYFSIISGSKVLIAKQDYDLFGEFNKLFVVRNIIEKKYIDKIDESKLVEGAVRGLAAGVGDPYTEYISPTELQAMNTEMQGEYAGVGLVVTMLDDKVTVVSPIEDTPGYKAGIKSGDIIIGVDRKGISGKKLNEVVDLLKGKPGTKVVITLAKKGETAPVDVTIIRENVVLNPIKSEMLKDNIGYIRITTFNQENVASLFHKALQDLKSKGYKGLILDLRDNGGGLLDQCTKIADELLGEGIIVYTIDNQGKKEVINSDKNKIDVPLVVLVNGGTASASEIVSGAVKDTNAGTLIGTKTFGKGIVQTIIPLPQDKSAIKVTIARYYTPSGICIQGIGIEPNIVLDLTDEQKKKTVLTRQEDTQLTKAIEVMKQKIQ